MPNTCMVGGFSGLLVMNAAMPLCLIAAMLSAGVAKVTYDHVKQGKSGRPPFVEGILLATPQVPDAIFKPCALRGKGPSAL